MSPLWRSLHLKQLLKFFKSGIFHKIIWILSKVGRPDDLFLMVQTAGVGTGNPCRQVSMLQCAQTPALPVTLLTPKPQASHHLPSHLPYSFVHTQMRHLFMSSSCPCRHFYIQVSDCQAKLIGWDRVSWWSLGHEGSSGSLEDSVLFRSAYNCLSSTSPRRWCPSHSSHKLQKFTWTPALFALRWQASLRFLPPTEPHTSLWGALITHQTISSMRAWTVSILPTARSWAPRDSQ